MRLIDFLDRGAALGPDRACLIEGDKTWSYREAVELSRVVAERIHASGIDAGATAAVISGNDATAFVCVLGIARAERVWVPVNARNTPAETLQNLQAAECQIVFVHGAFAALVPQLVASVPSLRQIVLLSGSAAGATTLDEWLTGARAALPTAAAPPDRVAILGFTGGTTGVPKGVMLSDLAVETMTAAVLASVHFDRPPRYLAAAPLTHAAGALCFPVLALGGTIAVLAAPAPPAILDAIERHAIDTLFLPPTLIYKLLDEPGMRARKLDSVRHFLYAAAPIAPHRLREALERFGPVMVQMYGQTEAPMICTVMTAADHAEALAPGTEQRLSSCGRASAFARLAIMDSDGRLLPQGETGEVVVRSNLVMNGYFRAPEETAQAGRHGWHHTGDVGWLDADGFLYLVDRIKDIIITGGFNVYSAEVERVVGSHPAVADCAVVGAPDAHWGEAVTAVVELRQGQTLTPDALIAHCRGTLPGVKTPKRVEIWPALPRSSVGKVLKREVREHFWKGQQRRI